MHGVERLHRWQQQWKKSEMCCLFSMCLLWSTHIASSWNTRTCKFCDHQKNWPTKTSPWNTWNIGRGLSHALGLLVSVSRQLFFGFLGPWVDAMLWCLVFQRWRWWCCSSRLRKLGDIWVFFFFRQVCQQGIAYKNFQTPCWCWCVGDMTETYFSSWIIGVRGFLGYPRKIVNDVFYKASDPIHWCWISIQHPMGALARYNK